MEILDTAVPKIIIVIDGKPATHFGTPPDGFEPNSPENATTFWTVEEAQQFFKHNFVLSPRVQFAKLSDAEAAENARRKRAKGAPMRPKPAEPVARRR
ncbi:MAG: hypothetical protein ACLQVY_18175 [Limisphaerales bacterium]